MKSYISPRILSKKVIHSKQLAYSVGKDRIGDMVFHTLRWFENRRGKTIYRQPIKTTKGKRCCDQCEQTEIMVAPPKKGLPDHAQYIYECQGELRIEYFDKPVKIKDV